MRSFGKMPLLIFMKMLIKVVSCTMSTSNKKVVFKNVYNNSFLRVNKINIIIHLYQLMELVAKEKEYFKNKTEIKERNNNITCEFNV